MNDRGGENSPRNRTVTGYLDSYGLNKMTVSRWRKRLTDAGEPNDAKLEEAPRPERARAAMLKREGETYKEARALWGANSA